MRISKKIEQFTKEGYRGIQVEEIETYLNYYEKKEGLSFWGRQKKLRRMTANDLFDFLQFQVESGQAAPIDWNQLQDLF